MRQGSDPESFGPESEHAKRNLLMWQSSSRLTSRKVVQVAYMLDILFGLVLHKPVEGLLRSSPTICFERLIWPFRKDNKYMDTKPWYELIGANGIDDKWLGERQRVAKRRAKKACI